MIQIFLLKKTDRDVFKMRRIADRWYNRIVRDSRYNDKKCGRKIDPTHEYIHTDRLLELQNEQQNLCYYCFIQMNWIGDRRKNRNGLTLERRDNRLPHYTDNCLGLCCKSCNSKRYSHDDGLLRRYFSKWRYLIDRGCGVEDGRRPCLS